MQQRLDIIALHVILANEATGEHLQVLQIHILYILSNFFSSGKGNVYPDK